MDKGAIIKASERIVQLSCGGGVGDALSMVLGHDGGLLRGVAHWSVFKLNMELMMWKVGDFNGIQVLCRVDISTSVINNPVCTSKSMSFTGLEDGMVDSCYCIIPSCEKNAFCEKFRSRNRTIGIRYTGKDNICQSFNRVVGNN